MTLKELAVQVFLNSPAIVLLKIAFTVVIGWLLGQIAGALGQSNIKGMITIGTIFASIYFVADIIWLAFKTVMSFAGVSVP